MRSLTPMPLYDFECQDCGRRFEDLVFEDDEENPVCPKCGSTNTLRLISEPSPMDSTPSK